MKPGYHAGNEPRHHDAANELQEVSHAREAAGIWLAEDLFKPTANLFQGIPKQHESRFQYAEVSENETYLRDKIGEKLDDLPRIFVKPFGEPIEHSAEFIEDRGVGFPRDGFQCRGERVIGARESDGLFRGDTFVSF